MDKIGIASTTYLYCAVNHCVGKNIGGHLITSASDLKDETNNQIKGNKINTAIKTVTAVPTIYFYFLYFHSSVPLFNTNLLRTKVIIATIRNRYTAIEDAYPKS